MRGYDALNTRQWKYWVVPAAKIQATKQSSMGLAKVADLAGNAIDYSDLAAAIETASFADAALIPAALLEARRLRDASTTATLAAPPEAGPAPFDAPPQPSGTDQLTLFT